MDPYSSPYVIPNNSLHNPFPPFPTKHQTDKLGAVYRTPWACSKAQGMFGHLGYRIRDLVGLVRERHGSHFRSVA